MKVYKELIIRVLDRGQWAETRAGRTVYLFGETIEFNLAGSFPIFTTRQIDYKQAFGELAAFIHGATTVSEFKMYGCNYWSRYPEELGPIYGAQWRNFEGVDQLDRLITDLITDPHSRRHILSTWNPHDLSKMALPPCHLLAQWDVSTTNVLSCVVYMRSVDVMLGLPYDVIVYALLTHLLSREAGYSLGKLKFFFGNTHIYANHIEQVNKVLEAPVQPGPTIVIAEGTELLSFLPEQVEVRNYVCNLPVKFPLNL